MLTTEDIELMSRTYSEEIANLRKVSVYFIREIETSNGDPYQDGGTSVEEITDETITDVVWTHIKSITESGMKSVINGIVIEKDDVLATITTIVDTSNVKKVKYGGATYRVMTTSPLGIGETNRVEMLLRKVT